MHIKVLMKTVLMWSRYCFSVELLCDDVLDFPHPEPWTFLAFNTLETPHLVECRENAAGDAEGNHDEKYYEFHNCMILLFFPKLCCKSTEVGKE